MNPLRNPLFCAFVALSITVLVALGVMMINGCASSPQTVAYKTIGSIEASAVAAYDGYCTLVINGTISTNSVPRVAAAFNQLQADALLAATVASQGTNGLATESLTADLSALTSVVSTASKIK